MNALRTMYARRRLALLSAAACVVSALTFVPLGYFSALVWFDCHNDITSWAAPGSPALEKYERFTERFGNLEFIAASWEGCTVDDPRLREFAERLAAQDTAGYFAVVDAAPQLIDKLTDAPLSASPENARRRLQGVFVGPDLETAGALMTLSEEGLAHRQEVTRAIQRAAAEVGVPPGTLHLGGPGYSLGQIDYQSVAAPLSALPVVIVVVALLLWARLGSWRLTLLITAIGFCASNALTGSVYASGLRMNAILSTLPTLSFLICVSNTLHLTNYFLNRPRRDAAEAMRWALSVGWKPTLFSGVTTALGLLSLLVSDTQPIRQFGAYGAWGVACSVALALLVFPLIVVWAMQDARVLRITRVRYRRRRWSKFWQWIGQATVAAKWPLLIVTVLALPPLVMGLPKLRTSIQVDGFFSAGGEVMTSVHWLQENLAQLDSFELAVEFAEADPDRPVDRLVLVEALERAVAQVEGVATTASVTRFTPALGRRGGGRNIARRSLVNDYLRDNRDQLEETLLWRVDETRETWRISARTSAMAAVTTIEPRILEAVQEALDRFPGAGEQPIDWWLTGPASLYREVEQQFLRDLARTYVTGFLVVSLVVLVLLRSPTAGALAMLPNALPALLVLGCIGWSGAVLEVGSIMTASIALGIAVDDTLHFVYWCRRKLESGLSASRAIGSTMLHCGDAMAQTSIVCGAGTAMLAITSFLPTVRFGLLLSGMLLAALLADLVVLPALIALRPRTWFNHPTHDRPEQSAPD